MKTLTLQDMRDNAQAGHMVIEHHVEKEPAIFRLFDYLERLYLRLEVRRLGHEAKSLRAQIAAIPAELKREQVKATRDAERAIMRAVAKRDERLRWLGANAPFIETSKRHELNEVEIELEAKKRRLQVRLEGRSHG